MNRLFIRTFLLLAALSSAGACSQGKGDPCQITSDCESPYWCCPGLASDRGTCVDRSECANTSGGAGSGSDDDSGSAGSGGEGDASSEESSSE